MEIRAVQSRHVRLPHQIYAIQPSALSHLPALDLCLLRAQMSILLSLLLLLSTQLRIRSEDSPLLEVLRMACALKIPSQRLTVTEISLMNARREGFPYSLGVLLQSLRLKLLKLIRMVTSQLEGRAQTLLSYQSQDVPSLACSHLKALTSPGLLKSASLPKT